MLYGLSNSSNSDDLQWPWRPCTYCTTLKVWFFVQLCRGLQDFNWQRIAWSLRDSWVSCENSSVVKFQRKVYVPMTDFQSTTALLYYLAKFVCSKLPLNVYSYTTRHRASWQHSLTFCVWRYVVVATKPVHRLQIRQIVHNQRAPRTIPPSYIRVHAVVWECGEGQTDRQTDTHRRPWFSDQYTFRLGYIHLARNIIIAV